MKTAFIAWERYNRRSDLLAQHLGATMHHIYYGQRGRLLQAPLRYLVQGRQTWHLLSRERPAVVFVQNPPISCALVAFLYARRYHARYIIDSHTSSFLAPKWRWTLGLHRMLSRRAVTTIVTNNHLKEMVSRWGCPAFVLGFTPGDYPQGEPFPFIGQFNVAVVSSFEWDEPLDVVFETAALLPEVSFYVTGDYTRGATSLLARKPENCHLTGYIPYEQYVGLLRGVDVVIDLVTCDHTLLLGAFEAVSLGTPLITSDWPILREYFPIGTVYVPNTVKGLCEGVRQAQREQAKLQWEVRRLREQLHTEWAHKLNELQELLRGH
jgi:glycosyltransferase involved in cell wall biosynthesis